MALDSQIEQNAQDPRKVSGQGVSAEQHSLPDQVAADEYLENKEAGGNVANVLRSRTFKIKPPGAG